MKIFENLDLFEEKEMIEISVKDLNQAKEEYEEIVTALKSLLGVVTIAQANSDKKTTCLWMGIGNKSGVAKKVEAAVKALTKNE